MANKNILIPCNQEYKEKIKAKAKEKGFTMATYIRIAIDEKIKNDNKENNNE